MDDPTDGRSDPTLEQGGDTKPILAELLAELRAIREILPTLATRGEVASLREEVASLREEVASLRGEVASLSARVDELASELRDFKAEIRHAIAETRVEMHTAIRNEALTSSSRFADIERRLTRLEDQIRAQ
jgi:polyhydroxyalkanoate synthesis regulator phasin